MINMTYGAMLAATCLLIFCCTTGHSKTSSMFTGENNEEHIKDNIQEFCELVQILKLGKIVEECERTTKIADMVMSLTMSEVLVDTVRREIYDRRKDEMRYERVYRARAKKSTAYNRGRFPSYFWNHTTIAYVIGPEFDLVSEARIRTSMTELSNKTCINMVETAAAMAPTDHVYFNLSNNCSAFIGYHGGRHTVWLADGYFSCHSYFTALHEMLHVLGVLHTMQREDRDAFVFVDLSHVPFAEYGAYMRMGYVDGFTTYGTRYDYASVMHYDYSAGSFMDTPVLIPNNDWNKRMMGYNYAFTFNDAKVINSMYCSEICPRELPCENDGYTDPLDCNQCRCPDGLGGTFCDEVDQAADGGCHPFSSGYLDVEEQEHCIESRDFMNGSYLTGDKCYFWLNAPSGYSINFQFKDEIGLNTDRNDVCVDYVEIRIMKNLGIPGEYVCGNTLPFFPRGVLVSETNRALVVFQTVGRRRDYHGAEFGEGFRLCYSLTATSTLDTVNNEYGAVVVSICILVTAVCGYFYCLYLRRQKLEYRERVIQGIIEVNKTAAHRKSREEPEEPSFGKIKVVYL